MKFPRRRFLQMSACAAAFPAVSRTARAQAYPMRPVRMVLGLSPGGSVDIVTRLIGQWLSERLGQPFLIEHRPGASGDIATEAVVRAPADGYTLLIVLAANAINATLHDKLKFSPIRDLAMVAGMVRVPNVMEVHPDPGDLAAGASTAARRGLASDVLVRVRLYGGAGRSCYDGDCVFHSRQADGSRAVAEPHLVGSDLRDHLHWIRTFSRTLRRSKSGFR